MHDAYWQVRDILSGNQDNPKNLAASLLEQKIIAEKNVRKILGLLEKKGEE
jgi:ATP-dependent Zn protease